MTSEPDQTRLLCRQILESQKRMTQFNNQQWQEIENRKFQINNIFSGRNVKGTQEKKRI